MMPVSDDGKRLVVRSLPRKTTVSSRSLKPRTRIVYPVKRRINTGLKKKTILTPLILLLTGAGAYALVKHGKENEVTQTTESKNQKPTEAVTKYVKEATKLYNVEPSDYTLPGFATSFFSDEDWKVFVTACAKYRINPVSSAKSILCYPKYLTAKGKKVGCGTSWLSREYHSWDSCVEHFYTCLSGYARDRYSIAGVLYWRGTQIEDYDREGEQPFTHGSFSETLYNFAI